VTRRHLLPIAAVELVLVAWLAVALSSGRDGTAGARPAAAPAPPSFVLGRRAGALAVGLAVRSEPGDRLGLETSVRGSDGLPVSGLSGEFSLRGTRGSKAAHAAACGSGCYRAELTPAGTPRLVVFRLTRPNGRASAVRYPLPRMWPPPRATRLVERATRAYRALGSVSSDQQLASGLGPVLRTHYVQAAPDRLTYRIEGGAQAVVIGARRWDRAPGGRWRESASSVLHLPAPPWTGRPFGATLIGRDHVRGLPADVVAFMTRQDGFPIWFTVWLERPGMLLLKTRMVASGHFMTETYRSFDAPVRIVPPGHSRP
jgi:hypothetical protein